jgi:hypothetical protein
MKKLLLFVFSAILFTAAAARPVPVCHANAGMVYTMGSDTLELYDTLGNKINNATIKVSGTDPNVDALVGHIWLKNTTNTAMTNLFVRRVMNQEVAGTTNSFCFGIQCYPPWTNESSVADTAKVGVINKSFYADYYPSGFGGMTSVTYEFFDNVTFGVPVMAKATIEFAVSGVGIAEDKLVFKGPYPNPASQQATFEYTIPSGAGNTHLIIRNMLGVEVANLTIDERGGKKSIDVSSYASGIYFYSLMIDGKVMQSKKLIVKH